MAEENQKVLEKPNFVVDNANISNWQLGLAQAVNDTYSYATNSFFYGLYPAFYQDYAYRYIRIACQWLDGYVTSLHANGISGIISTRIGNKLITGLTKQIVGEKLIFKLANNGVGDGDKTMSFISKWSEEQNAIKSVYAGIGFSLGVGTSCIKINKTNANKLWWEAVRMDKCFYLTNFKNEIQDAYFIIRNYIDTREDKQRQQYFLIEHRFWKVYEKPEMIKKVNGTIEVLHKKGERIPMVEYQIQLSRGTSMNQAQIGCFLDKGINWKELPQFLRESLKRDYSAIRVNEPQPIGLSNLGVEVLLNGHIDLGVPTSSGFGESMLVGVQDDLITYELASSYLIRDMYNGKGTIYLPKNLSLGDIGDKSADNVLQGFGDTKYELLKGLSPEQQQAIVQQFNLRAVEWQTIKENSLRNIAVKWGMSPKILSSFLAVGSAQMTATQVDSEDDMSIAFIYHTRSYYKPALNRLLETTLNFYGLSANVKIDFASPSLVNKDRILDRTLKELESGLIDLEEAIRTLNPDLDEETIQEKIEKAKAQQQQMMLNQMTEMNSDGTFGQDNNYDDLGGDNLNGSTSPAQ
jgi:hypothetical protein